MCLSIPRLKEWAFRTVFVTKAECLDLPEKLPDKIVCVEMSKRQRKLYEMMAKDSAIPEMDILADNPLARLLRLRQISSGFIADENGTAEDISDADTPMAKAHWVLIYIHFQIYSKAYKTNEFL